MVVHVCLRAHCHIGVENIIKQQYCEGNYILLCFARCMSAVTLLFFLQYLWVPVARPVIFCLMTNKQF